VEISADRCSAGNRGPGAGVREMNEPDRHTGAGGTSGPGMNAQGLWKRDKKLHDVQWMGHNDRRGKTKKMKEMENGDWKMGTENGKMGTDLFLFDVENGDGKWGQIYLMCRNKKTAVSARLKAVDIPEKLSGK